MLRKAYTSIPISLDNEKDGWIISYFVYKVVQHIVITLLLL